MRATSIGHAGILVETDQASIACDPWFLPAFFGSWFVFPRNDRLGPDLMGRIEQPDYLYVSHLHGDHLDLPWLRAGHVSRDTTVLLPGFPTDELERTFRQLGFTRLVHTQDGVPVDLGGGLTVTIHTETSITDGPGGDSAIIVDDGRTRLLNQNDCRINDLAAMTAAGPIDVQWLQYSGAIWYPMVYEVPPDEMRRLVDAKVESQLSRAVRYVEAVGARAVVPSAGPPCFLDPELFGFNLIDGDELSIFPDQLVFLQRLREAGLDTGHLLVPGSTLVVEPGEVRVEHAVPRDEVLRPFRDKRSYLLEYQADWKPWLDDERARWVAPQPDLVGRLAAWWEPLLDQAPTLRAAVGSVALLCCGDEEIAVDFPRGQVRPYAGEPYAFRFHLPRELVETVVAERAADWSNALFLSCRFRAWREGAFNEFLYNFFKSLSDERIVRAEEEARAKTAAPEAGVEEIELGGYVMERWCPHRKADLAAFGHVEGETLTCSLHGWQFDLATGRCLTADDRHLRVRPAPR